MKALAIAARLATATFGALLALPATAQTPPTVRLVPPDGARFLPGQRFDIRVEVDAASASATLDLNGTAIAFTSGAPSGADGISAAGVSGFNVRGFSITQPGTYTLRAVASAGGPTTTVTTTFRVVDLPNGLGGPGRVKNVILFIGDGMGLAHRTAARIVRHGVTNGDPDGKLAMDTMPGTGFLSTHSLNSIVTDSAPGMSGYSTGNHQNNNQEGVWPARVTNPFFAPRVEYLGQYLKRVRGTALGIVSTADVEDATPAANAVHTAARGNGTGIVDQYLDEADRSGLAVLMGGGRRWFVPASNTLSSRASGTDYGPLPSDLVTGWNLGSAPAAALDPERDVIAGFKAGGFAYADSRTALGTALAASPSKLLGLFAWGNMNTASDKIAERRGDGAVVNDHLAPDQPMLDEMTDAALAVLGRNAGGFVLMVEGAHIDKQSHAMDADRAIVETIELDKAVARGLDFAARDGHTLVLVTADHECSGFSLIGALTGKTPDQLRTLASDLAVVTPDAQPERQKVVGVYDAAGFPRYSFELDGYPTTMDPPGKMLVGFGANGDRFEDWLAESKPIIESLTPTALKAELAAKGYPASALVRTPESQNGFFVRGQVSDRTTAVHTATDVPISAYAGEAEVWRRFVGSKRNTDVFFDVASLMLGEAPPDVIQGPPGEQGPAGPRGKSGCSTGFDAGVLSCIALIGLALIRRRVRA